MVVLRRSLVVFAVTTATLGACSSFGVTSGPSDPDAAASLDAGRDSALGDGLTEASATRDASPCAKPVLHVEESFTVGTFPPSGWALSEELTNATLTRDPSSEALSPPAALHALVSDNKVDAFDAVVRQTLVSSVASIDLHFAVKLKEPAVNSYAELGCSLRIANAAGERLRLIFARGGSGDVRGKGFWLTANKETQLGVAVTSPAFEPGWYKVHERVTLANDGTVMVALTTTATTGVVGEATYQFTAGKSFDSIEVQCGLEYADPSPTSLSAFVDDIAIDICPQ